MLELSIIIPVYNGVAYIERCVDSIIKSGLSSEKYEIIAVDDNSTDDSLAVLQAKESQLKNFRVFHRRKAGPGGARNLGLNYARARYVMFVDVDDVVESAQLTGFVNNLLPLYTHHIIGFDCDKVDVQGNRSSIYAETPPYCRDISGAAYMARYPLIGKLWAYVFNRSFLLAANVRLLEKCVLEDEDFVTRLFAKAESVTFLPITLYRYHFECKTGLSNIPDEDHQKRLMNDRLTVIVGLKRMREAICDPNLEEGLDRKLCDLVVDTLRILVMKPYDEHQVYQFLEILAKESLYPIPTSGCGKVSRRLCRATDTPKKILRWRTRSSSTFWRYIARRFLCWRIA